MIASVLGPFCMKVACSPCAYVFFFSFFPLDIYVSSHKQKQTKIHVCLNGTSELSIGVGDCLFGHNDGLVGAFHVVRHPICVALKGKAGKENAWIDG